MAVSSIFLIVVIDKGLHGILMLYGYVDCGSIEIISFHHDD